MIQFSAEESRLMFCLIIVVAPFLLQLGKYAKNNITRDVFIVIAFLVVFVPLAFRSGGIDHEVYRKWYEQPSLVLQNPLTPEPLYAALSLFASKIHWFQLCYIIPAYLFTFGLFFYTLKRGDDFFCTSIIVLMSIYIYMCGVTRFSAALGLLWIAFENFDKRKRFFLLLILATLFHYTAVVGLLVYVAYRSKRAISIKIFAFFTVGLYAVAWLVGKLGSSLYVFERVSQYFTLSFDLSALKNVILILPAYLLLLFNYPTMRKLYKDSFQIKNMMVLLLAFIAVSVFLPGTFRLCWFFLIFAGDVYGRMPRVIMQNKNAVDIMLVYKIIIAVVAVLYQYAVFFDSPYITKLVIPFGFNL